MGIRLTDRTIKFIEAKNFAHLATLLPDGSPHVTPMWIDRDGDTILLNTALGRVKQKNVARDPRVSIDIADSNNPYDRIIIHGRRSTKRARRRGAHR